MNIASQRMMYILGVSSRRTWRLLPRQILRLPRIEARVRVDGAWSSGADAGHRLIATRVIPWARWRRAISSSRGNLGLSERASVGLWRGWREGCEVRGRGRALTPGSRPSFRGARRSSPCPSSQGHVLSSGGQHVRGFGDVRHQRHPQGVLRGGSSQGQARLPCP